MQPERRRTAPVVAVSLLGILLTLLAQLAVGVYWAGEISAQLTDLNNRVTRLEQFVDGHNWRTPSGR